MMLKKIVSAALSVALLGSSATLCAFAGEPETQKTYNYVALGDSIGSGYGLDGKGASRFDRALILNEDLIANPIQDAYAQVFGGYLAELGAENGYVTSAVNLSSTAYRAEDVEKTILMPGVKGEVAAYIFETFVGQGSSDALLAYHDIYEKYLTKADMVSIQLGGNDIVMGVIYPMIKADNPILNTAAYSMSLVLFGYDPKAAIAAGMKRLEQVKDELTLKDIANAAQYFAGVAKNAEKYVEDSAENVRKVVQAVKTVNNDTDIALIGMFNPFGNSLEYNGQVRDLCTVLTNVFVRAASEAIDVNIEIGDITITPSSQTEENCDKLQELTVDIKEIVVDDSYFSELRKQRVQALVKMIAEEISYPVQYLTLGKNVDPQMKLLNQKLSAIAEEEGATYVDIYDISNENNLDPHPNKNGHREIADRLYATLADIILSKMQGSEAQEWLIGDVNMDDDITISDVTELQKAIAGMVSLSELQTQLGDINDNGEIDISDATELQRYVAQFPASERIGTPLQTGSSAFH